MRLLADENIGFSLIHTLRNAGHDVLSVKESMTGADDQAILSRGVAERRVLLTFDKDFGELTFRSRLPASCGVVLLRLTPEGRERDTQRIVDVILSRDDWSGAFRVINHRGIRKRALLKPSS